MKINGVYALGLTGNKYYIGYSKDINQRIKSHLNGTGAIWTQKHKPEKIIEIRVGKDTHEEMLLTRFYMGKYGADNVRGGPWCTEELPENPLTITDAVYESIRHGTYYRGIERPEDINNDTFTELQPVTEPKTITTYCLPTIDHDVTLEYRQIVRCPVNRSRKFIIHYMCDANICEFEFGGMLPCAWEFVTRAEVFHS